MQRVRIVHQKPPEAASLIERVQASGLQAEYSSDTGGPSVVRAIRDTLPDIVLIDLSRLPSHGREIGAWMRRHKRTQNIPIVFANGEPDKVGRVREVIPDAIYTTTPRLPTALKRAGAKRVEDLQIPAPVMERYKERTAAQKLGITDQTTVCVIDAPRDYLSVLGDLPESVEPVEDPEAPQSLTLWFTHDLESLLAALCRMRALAAKTKLWILWPKSSRNGLNQNSIRAATREGGLVDYKICSVNERWSAMLFARKKT